MGHQPQDPVGITMDQIGYRRQSFLGQWVFIAGRIFQLESIRDGLPPDGVSGSMHETPNVPGGAEGESVRNAAKVVNIQSPRAGESF
jgi:hypothetical protein